MEHNNHNILITTPIYYVNGSPHIGHAYTSIVADFYARFYRMTGANTYLLTGTDEHGQKVAQTGYSGGISSEKKCKVAAARVKRVVSSRALWLGRVACL